MAAGWVITRSLIFRGLSRNPKPWILGAGFLKSPSLSSVASQKPKPDWNRAVSDAEKLVGYPTSYLSLRCLLSDEISNIAQHIRKLVGTNHPLLKIAKRLIYNGKNNMQTRGLIVLLMSKAAGLPESAESLDNDAAAGVLSSQRSLAEITEMIHTAHLIHKGVVNTSCITFEDGTTLNDMEFGNKIAILSGDYLLANACLGLASLRNTYVVEIIAKAIGNSMEAEFVGTQDDQGFPLPEPGITMDQWLEKSFLSGGSLLANSCKSALLLAGHSTELQEWAYEFGKYLALAWQSHSDIQVFVDPYRFPPGTAFDLTSSLVILHLQKDPSLMDLIEQANGNAENVDYKQVHERICAGSAISEAREICCSYAERALKALHNFHETDARNALENIVNALKTT